MFEVKDSVRIAAPVERVFRLSTSVELVRRTLGMRPVGGRVAGHVVAWDTVEWRGWKFGLPQMHTSLITGYEEPIFFQDTQRRGRFAEFHHDHFFEETAGGTLLRDAVYFSLPLGWAGRMVGKAILVPHVAGLLRQRFGLLKELAEGAGWREVLGE